MNSGGLSMQAAEFQRASTKLTLQMRCRKYKAYLIFGAAALIVLFYLYTILK